jgi:hypothetical protein
MWAHRLVRLVNLSHHMTMPSLNEPRIIKNSMAGIKHVAVDGISKQRKLPALISWPLLANRLVNPQAIPLSTSPVGTKPTARALHSLPLVKHTGECCQTHISWSVPHS